jgi:hypothetical protein
MFFRQRAAAHATLSYVFGCAGIGKAVLVDVVAGDEDWFMAEAARQGASIPVVNTPKQPGMDDIVAADLRGALPARAAA